MAEDPRFLLHFKTLAKFKEKLADGTINENRHLVFIKDEKLLWCRGVYYSDASKLDNFSSYYNDWSVDLTNANTITITLKGNKWNSTTRKWEAISKSITLNAATDSISGLMSAQDKRQLDIIDTANFLLKDPTTTATTVTINASHTDVNTEARNLATSKSLTSATADKAGILTAQDKRLLDIISTVNFELTLPTTTATNIVLHTKRTDVNSETTNIADSESETVRTLPSVTSTNAGVMIATDKLKLDRIIGTNYSIDNPTSTITDRTIRITGINPNTNITITSDVTIPSASLSLAGLMNTTDKLAIDNVKALGNISHMNDTTPFSRTATDVKINYSCKGISEPSTNAPTAHSESIGAASSTLAGVMTAASYNLLYTTIPNNITAANTAITNEVARATAAEKTISDNLAAEITRAKGAESTLTTNLNSEIDRAKGAESTLTTNLSSHTSNTSNPHSVTKAQVGLGNVTNESKETMFTSPTFTGTPTAPTAAKGTNTTLIATTAFVQSAAADAVTAIVAGADESFDTLKEISDWISSHGTTAATMNSLIQTNKTNIANNATAISTINSKLSGIASGAEVNVLSDWNVTDTTSDAYIKNKPGNASLMNAGFMTANDKKKLDGITTGANLYILPNASTTTLGGIKVGTNLSIDSSGVLSATDTKYNAATDTTAGLMSADDKKKLDGIAASANNYSLPLAALNTRGGIKVGNLVAPPTWDTITLGDWYYRKYPVKLHGEVAYTEVPWTDTTYSVATTTTNGLLSASDKTKLDGIATGANKYVLPISTAESLGGIKIGYAANNRNYPVKLNLSGQAYVNVPWISYSNATPDSSGLMDSLDKSRFDRIYNIFWRSTSASWLYNCSDKMCPATIDVIDATKPTITGTTNLKGETKGCVYLYSFHPKLCGSGPSGYSMPTDYPIIGYYSDYRTIDGDGSDRVNGTSSYYTLPKISTDTGTIILPKAGDKSKLYFGSILVLTTQLNAVILLGMTSDDSITPGLSSGSNMIFCHNTTSSKKYFSIFLDDISNMLAGTFREVYIYVMGRNVLIELKWNNASSIDDVLKIVMLPDGINGSTMPVYFNLKNFTGLTPGVFKVKIVKASPNLEGTSPCAYVIAEHNM